MFPRAPFSTLSFTVSLLLGVMLLPACGDDDDDDEGAGGAATGSPLSNLLSGFGSGEATGNPMSGADTDGGVDGTDGGPATGGGPHCVDMCDRILECMSPGGCPNFDTLSPTVIQETKDACVGSCAGVTDEQYAAVEQYTCQQVVAEITADPEVAAFCALTPASKADCDTLCIEKNGCDFGLSEEKCRGICYFGEGVTCLLTNECNIQVCKQHFPDDDDDAE